MSNTAESNWGQVGAIVRAKTCIALHHLGSVRTESKLKIAVVSGAAILLWIGAYFLFLRGFDAILDFGGREGAFNFGELLLRHVLGLLTLAVFLLLIFSNTFVAFSTLYKSHEVVYLLQGPLSCRHFFHARFLECIVFSSWSLAYLGSPMLLAYGQNVHPAPAFYAAILLLFLPYIVVPASIGCILCMVLVRVFPSLRKNLLILLGLLAVTIFYAYLSHVMEETRVSGDTTVSLFFQAVERTQTPLLPSTWAAASLNAAGDNQLGEALFQGALLLSTALFLLWAAGETAERIFYTGWSRLRGLDRQRIVPEGAGLLGKLPALLRPVRNPERALLIKDIKLFWRDPTQWSQFVIFFGIMAIYIANLRRNDRLFDIAVWRGWVACLNIGTLSLILATLTSRFVFPMVSLEGRRFWILGLAPLTYRQLLWQKFWCSVATTSGFTVGLAVLSGCILQLSPFQLFLTVYGITAANFSLAGLAVGLGALYPNFSEDNPARIVSGLGGTLNLLLSVGYVTVVAITMTFVVQAQYFALVSRGQERYLLGGALFLITGLSFVCAWLPMRLGLRNLNQMEH